MELIYSMRRKPLRCEPPQIDSDPEVVKPICTISSANIIAFSSTTKLSDFDGDSWGGHVYICDLDTPWDSHHVTSTQSPITALEWDCEGKHLLVATSVGDVSVFGQRDYLLNDWMCLYTASFPGEFICKAILFHNGRRVVSVDKKVDSSATEKLQISRLTPTLRGFGGIACEGACVVTSTGLLCALVPPVTTSSEPPAGPSRTQTSILPPPQALTTMECLRATRDHIVAASFAHKNGNLLIATVCASPAINNMGSGRCVRCHLGSVRRSTTPAHAPHLAVQPLPSLYVTDDPGLPPSISWCIHEDGDCLLIGGAVLSLWKLMERAHHVHKLLAKGPVPGNTTSSGVQKPLDCFNTLAWQQMAIWSWETIGSGGGGGNAVCVSALRPSPPRALVATSRGVHLLYRDKLTHICSKQVVAGGGDILPVGTAAPKKAKYGTVIMNGSCATLCCVETSWNGGVAVVLDTHSQLHVYKVVQPCPDIPSPLYVQHFANGLEYALVAGYDYLDLLLALKPAAREPLYDRMTEWLSRQPVAFRQFYQSAWLNLRAALCRLMPNGQTRASELTSLQTLHSIWACVEAAVRPTELGEKGPLEALQSLLEDQPAAHIDLDKILVSLDAKELSCEPGTVCALRRVLERAADIALSLLAALSQHNLVLPSGQLHHHGYELWSDPQALNLLRKILAVARVWCVGAGAGTGAGGARGLHSRIPDSLDVLPLLYRPLTRLLTGKPVDVIEEVCTLITQTGGAPRVWESLPRCNVSAPHGKSWPLYLEYLIEPEGLRYSPERPAPPTEPPVPQPALDSIRYMYLGGGCRAARWRQCGRCGALALPTAHCARHPAQRAHDSRFLASCRCGGKWTLCSNI